MKLKDNGLTSYCMEVCALQCVEIIKSACRQNLLKTFCK